MLQLTLLYSDLIGGFLGILGSIVLAYPYISEITDRRHWELLVEFRQQINNAEGQQTPEEREAYQAIRDRMIDDRLGQHAQYRWVTMIGFFLLLAAFLFITVASITRLNSP